MIQKMKKLTFLIYYKEYDQFLKSLQKLGVIHVQESNDQSMAERMQTSDEILEKEDNIKVIQEIMGHADIRTTMEIYAEATEESMDDAMNRLSEQLI